MNLIILYDIEKIAENKTENNKEIGQKLCRKFHLRIRKYSTKLHFKVRKPHLKLRKALFKRGLERIGKNKNF